MEQLNLPQEFLLISKCITSDALEDGRQLVGLCSTSGQLLELIDGKVVDSYDLDSDVDDIKIFTAYNPLQKYYLIRCGEQLTILKRQTTLCVVKTYDNVKKVEVEDRLGVGRPQAVIWTGGDREPTVTDFSSQLITGSAPYPVPPLTASLSTKLQDMNLRLVKAKKLLQMKRETCNNALYQCTPHRTPPTNKNQEEMVIVCGSIPEKPPVPQPALRLLSPWRRVHNDKWIIGVPVHNTTTDLDVGDVRLLLKMEGGPEPQLKYEVHVITFRQRQSPGAQWMTLGSTQALFDKVTTIPGSRSAVVAAVLEEPILKTSHMIKISGAILYNQQNELKDDTIQDPLDPIEFSVDNLIQGSLQPFSSEIVDEADVLGVALASRVWSLRVTARHRLAPPLRLTDSGLRPMQALGCWVGTGPLPGALTGALVTHRQTSAQEHQLEVYAKDLKQALQLVHSLRNRWRVEVLRPPEPAVSDCVNSLSAELRMLLTSVRPGCVLAADKWADLRKQLNSLELATDLNFFSYCPSS